MGRALLQSRERQLSLENYWVSVTYIWYTITYGYGFSMHEYRNVFIESTQSNFLVIFLLAIFKK